MEEEVKDQGNEKVEEVSPAETALRSLAKPLEKMTVKDLREIGKEIPGVSGVHAMKKDEVLDLLYEYSEAVGIGLVRPVDAKKAKAAVVPLSVKELKTKAARLREEKTSAREQGDHAKVDLLRRRIGRVKKKTRRAVRP